MSDEQQRKQTDDIIARKEETLEKSRAARDSANVAIDALRKAVDTLTATQIDLAGMIGPPRWTHWVDRDKS